MGRYIDAQKLDVFRCAPITEYDEGIDFLFDEIDRLPAEDVAPVVHAHWMDTFQAENGYYMGICSHCYLPNIVSLYCGKCGAKMDEGV